ncbi:MAG: hypothetical protein AAF411_07295 [Myxococcota bacterium]
MKRLTYLMALLTIACGGGESGGSGEPGTTLPGRDLPCRAASCGDDAVRSAVPTRDLLRIDFEAVASKDAQGLESPSDFYLETLAHVQELNEIIDLTFDELEFAAGAEPVIEGQDHLWRTLAGETEIVLDIDTEDGRTYDIAFFEGPPGFEATAPIVEGSMVVDGDQLVELALVLDVGELAAAEGVRGAGQILMAARPFAGGEVEVIFDTRGLLIEDEEIADSETTYWTFDESNQALAFFEDVEDEAYSVYVRWADDGGRWDSHSAVDDEVGILDEIVTVCWDASAAETFAGEAVLNEDMEFDAELAGDEDDCLFGPIADDPRGGVGFENLPGEGEWQALDEIGCDPEIQSCPDTCEDTLDCGDGEICDAGECVADVGCDDDLDCNEGEVCDAGGTCVDDGGCDDDLDCDEGEVCDAGGVCVADEGACIDDDDCDLGFICDVDACVPGCRIDDDCEIGFVCDFDFEECVPE